VPATQTSVTFGGLTQETTYTFTVTAHNLFGNDSQTSNPATPGRCTGTQVSAVPVSPSPVGTQVQLTASSNGCPNPQYQFWIEAPGAATYTLAQAYSSNATYSWNTSGLAPGAYLLDVWSRDAASPGNDSNAWGSWDDYNASDTYSLVVTPCKSVAESASPSGPLMAGGTSVSITATASGCSRPSYEFWVLSPGATKYALAQAYGPSLNLTWSTAGRPTGLYRFNVWARDASSTGIHTTTGSGAYDAYTAGLIYTLTKGCPGVTEWTSPPTSAAVSTAVTISAYAPGCSNPEFEFWILSPGATSYTLARTYSASASFTWSTAGNGKGIYRVNVWVRQAGTTGVFSNPYGGYDAYNAGLTFGLT